LNARLPALCKIGEPVLLEVELLNSRDYDLSWVESRANDCLDIRVQDLQGAPVPPTEERKRELAGANRHRYRLVTRKLEPRQKYSWNIDLARMFQFRPGEYAVSVLLYVTGAGGVAEALELKDLKVAIQP
jgi:hypothetical protein